MFKLTTSSTKYIQTNKHIVKQKKMIEYNPKKSDKNGEKDQKKYPRMYLN